MKGEWFCPCILLIGGGAWLAVSTYFSITHFENLKTQSAEWTGDSCTLRKLNVEFCHYSDAKGRKRHGCRASLAFAGAKGASDVTLVHEHEIYDGCVFQNCAIARKWARERIPGKTTKCWRSRKGSARVVIDDPAGSSRRDSIIFSICACLAGLLVLGALFMMCSLIIKGMKSGK